MNSSTVSLKASVLASPPFGVVGVLLSGAAASRPRLCAVPPLPRAAVRLRRSRRSRSVAPALNALPPAASRLRCPCAPARLFGQGRMRSPRGRGGEQVIAATAARIAH